MMRVYIGVDPGLDGAVAWIVGDEVRVFDTPAITKAPRDYLTASMAEILDQARAAADGGTLFAALERQQAMPSQGVSSTFKLGRGAGLWEGILAGQRIPYALVTPQAWRKVVGVPDHADKAQSRVLAQRLFPTLAGVLVRVKDHGRAEALLLALYAQRISANG